MVLHYDASELQRLSLLPEREQEVALFRDLRFGRVTDAKKEHVVDMSQTLGRNGSLWNGIPCIAPKG
eukprot:8230524-Pyramimonas_sp.AAC.1